MQFAMWIDLGFSSIWVCVVYLPPLPPDESIWVMTGLRGVMRVQFCLMIGLYCQSQAKVGMRYGCPCPPCIIHGLGRPHST